MFGESVSGLRKDMAEQVETRFQDIRLDVAVPPSIMAKDLDDRYLLPAPAYAPDLPEIVTADRQMLQVMEQVHRAARASLPVLVRGETGTGKELVARALHRLGGRAQGPFVPVNCAAIPVELLERELFGHLRGAYTGAHENRGGLFEAASEGLLFLDEIDEASLELQVRLLRVIEEQAVRRVGEQQLRPIDVRIVTATNRDLEQAVAENNFRQDLLFRLSGMEIHLPPLRERQDDIPHLASHALDTWARRREKTRPGVTQSAMEILLNHDWPGNVRELLNVVEWAAEEAGGKIITPQHLSIRLSGPPAPRSDRNEHQRITAALRATEGNVSAAARRLGISRNTIYRRMRQLGIQSTRCTPPAALPPPGSAPADPPRRTPSAPPAPPPLARSGSPSPD